MRRDLEEIKAMIYSQNKHNKVHRKPAKQTLIQVLPHSQPAHQKSESKVSDMLRNKVLNF